MCNRCGQSTGATVCTLAALGFGGPWHSPHSLQVYVDLCAMVMIDQSLILTLCYVRVLQEKVATIPVHDQVDVLCFCQTRRWHPSIGIRIG